MRIAIGTDHRGLELKAALAAFLREKGHEVADLGAEGEGSVDYPGYAFAVAGRVASGEADRGLLICGTGIGMSIAANKVEGVRAALVYDEDSLRLSREHNDANVLVLPGNWLPAEKACVWVEAWLDIEFTGERHRPRLDQIAEYERKPESGKQP